MRVSAAIHGLRIREDGSAVVIGPLVLIVCELGASRMYNSVARIHFFNEPRVLFARDGLGGILN